jgi:chromodomain-helicase-DNA-binding protein 1
MSTSSGASPVNGHARHSEDEHTGHISNGDQSDSDLSDVQAADADGPRSESAEVAVSAVQMPSIALEDPSDSSDNDASHDADFDMEGSPVSAQSSDEAHGGSIESRPAAKRKSTQGLEDEFMRENPELYGLRRSVRFPVEISR